MSYVPTTQPQTEPFFASENANRVYRAPNEEPPTTSDQEFHELQVPRTTSSNQMESSSYPSTQANSQTRYVNVQYTTSSNPALKTYSSVGGNVNAQHSNNADELKLPGPSFPYTSKISDPLPLPTFVAKVPDTKKYLEQFWVNQRQKMVAMTEEELKDKCKHMALPVARVKKIMRIDENVRNLMIAGDAPVFMAAAAELFIEEITGMSWHVVDETRRRTMLKTDIISSMHRNEQFDFLIDFIPRKRRRDTHKPMDDKSNSEQMQQTFRENGIQGLKLDTPSKDKNIEKGHISQVGREIGYSINDGLQSSNSNEMEYMESQEMGDGGVTISIDEHGNPVGDLPPGMQLVLENTADGGHQYRIIERGSNAEFEEYNGGTAEYRTEHNAQNGYQAQ